VELMDVLAGNGEGVEVSDDGEMWRSAWLLACREKGGRCRGVAGVSAGQATSRSEVVGNRGRAQGRVLDIYREGERWRGAGREKGATASSSTINGDVTRENNGEEETDV
jgi:hypothetical protein